MAPQWSAVLWETASEEERVPVAVGRSEAASVRTLGAGSEATSGAKGVRMSERLKAAATECQGY